MPRLMVSLGKKDLESADALASKVAADKNAHPMLLNAMAWELATYDGIKGPALDTAAKLAIKANDSLEGKDPAVLDTLARLKFLQGDKEKARELEQKAVELADGELKESLQKSLDSYKEGMRGGTGTTFDWHLAVVAKTFGRIILAGGLTPDNVAEAVKLVQPYGVDVASGVEREKGVKDHAMIKKFITEARKAARA
jgi:hypothetical protein